MFFSLRRLFGMSKRDVNYPVFKRNHLFLQKMCDPKKFQFTLVLTGEPTGGHYTGHHSTV